MTDPQQKRRPVSWPFLFSMLVLCGAGGYLYADLDARSQSADRNKGTVTESVAPASERLGFAWPPKVGEAFPDLNLVSDSGERVRLSQFKGKVILVEPVGMNCAACNAFAGARKAGGYEGTQPQQNLPPIENLLPRFAGGVTITDENIVLVHLVLFDMNLKAPRADDARKWAEHFGFDSMHNVHVLAGDERFMGPESYQMIPGFFLLDKEFILRADSTGHAPRQDLFRELLPMVPRLLKS